MADDKLTDEEQDSFNFMMNTAPEYVQIALRSAFTIGEACGIDGDQRAKLTPLVASVMHPRVATWLMEHHLLHGHQAIALASVMLDLHVALKLTDA